MLSSSASPKTRRLAVDIGGTFTDVAAFDEVTGELRLGKVLSTHDKLVDGISDGIAKAEVAFSEVSIFLHGSTIAINTLLERTGARTALVTTQGFRDIYEIGRVNRPDSYNLFFRKHEPLVERALRFEVKERVRADGQVHVPLDEDQVEEIAKRIGDLGMDSVAVMFLHCYVNPAHERRTKQILERINPRLFVSASHELSQEYREFERCSTVVANAYVGPRVRTYLREIDEHIRQDGFDGSFLVVQSTGGLYDAKQAQNHCVRMLESGPAAGVIGTQALCQTLGIKNAVAFDMGGTTAKAGVIHNGEALTTGHALIGDYGSALPIQIAMMDIVEVSAGGGSIARVDEGGAIKVGPQSAGSEPGPVCYGLGGTAPTVTDANLLLGRLSADGFLGGDMKLDRSSAEAALYRSIAAPLKLGVAQAAEGIVRIANTKMSYAVKGVTTERGFDPADFSMVSYGGAGPLHATAVARDLGIRTVIIPCAPGVFSAFGMLFSDLRYDFVRTWYVRLAELSFDQAERLYREHEDAGRSALGSASVVPKEIGIERAADMRYVGQEHAVTVSLPAALFESEDRAEIKRRFDAMHALHFGTCAPKEPAEIVSLRTTVSGVMPRPALQKIAPGEAQPRADALAGRRPVYFQENHDFVETPVYARRALLAANRIVGPALIEERESTTVLMAGDELIVDDYGNLVIAVGGRVPGAPLTTSATAAER